jgi:hypothetical protein
MVTPTQPVPRIRPSSVIKPTTPWQYVENWSMSDRGPSETLKVLNDRMQNRWPGKYRIVEKEVRNRDSMYRRIIHVFEFDSPKDETWFRLQWSK